MSYIPDCRTDENYNEKYLNKEDSIEIRGYDWCTEEVVDNFFNNLDTYFDNDSYIMHMLKQEIPEDEHDEVEYKFRFGSRESEMRQIKTYLDLIRDNLHDWIEGQRNEIIVSMIENMDDEDYKAIKEKVDGRQSETEN